MRGTSRFECPSVSLALGSLLGRPRTALWAVFGIALLLHLSLSQWRALAKEERAAKPLTSQFVKRQPRLSKPLELKKRPQPKRRAMQRKMVAVTARRTRKQTASGIQIPVIVGSLSRPRVQLRRAAGLGAVALERQVVAQSIQSQKEAKDVVDTSLDMLDVDALDTGRYYALVIQDPTDKRNIKGFFRLKYAYSQAETRPVWVQQGDWRTVHALVSMIDAMNQYTQIRASYEGKVPYTSAEMLRTPWAFCVIDSPFELSEAEAGALGKYLVVGGFLLCDAISPYALYRGEGRVRPPVAITNARHNFKSALATQQLEYGRQWRFEILPHNHPIFHCFFDFDGTPASHFDTQMYLRGDMEGASLDERLVVGIVQKACVHVWGDPNNPDMREERMVQFGINTIIFALTQEGSITRQLMDNIR